MAAVAVIDSLFQRPWSVLVPVTIGISVVRFRLVRKIKKERRKKKASAESFGCHDHRKKTLSELSRKITNRVCMRATKHTKVCVCVWETSLQRLIFVLVNNQKN